MPILPPPKYTDTTLKATSRLRGRERACNPSSSKVPAFVADEAAGLGEVESLSPHSQSEHTTSQRSTKHKQVPLDMHIERLVEGVLPMRLTSILTRATKSRKCQSVVPQLWRWIERRAMEHDNRPNSQKSKFTIHLLPQDMSAHVNRSSPVANWSVLGACYRVSALSESRCNTHTDVVVVARTQGSSNSIARLTVKRKLVQ